MPSKRSRLFGILCLYVLVVLVPGLILINLGFIKERFRYLDDSNQDTVFSEISGKPVKFTGEITDPTMFSDGKIGVTISSPPKLSGYRSMEIQCDSKDITINYILSDGSVSQSRTGVDLDLTDDHEIFDYLSPGFKVTSYCRDECLYLYKVCLFEYILNRNE